MGWGGAAHDQHHMLITQIVMRGNGIHLLGGNRWEPRQRHANASKAGRHLPGFFSGSFPEVRQINVERITKRRSHP